MMNYRRIQLSPVLRALLIPATILVLLCGVSVADPLAEDVSVSGYVLRERDGTPLVGENVRIDLMYNGQSVLVETDQNGYYHYDYCRVGHSLNIRPVLALYHDWNPFINSNPEFLHVYDISENTEADTLFIKPGVLVTVGGGYSGPSLDGFELFYGTTPIWEVVGTFDQGSFETVFYPDDYYYLGDPWSEKEYMPFSGEVKLLDHSPFTVIDPQDFTNEQILYDCSSTYLDADGPIQNLQYVLPILDLPTNYSWEAPGGLGWEIFPKTPDNRLPNNPNVYVEAEFSTAFGSLPKEMFRINGEYALFDLDDSNDHTAVFSYPIPQCGALDLGIEYKIKLRNGGEVWYPLETKIITSATDGNLAEPDSLINVADVVEFNKAFYSCLGDANYNSCANYDPRTPVDCINLSDLVKFSSIYNYNNTSKNLSGPTGGQDIDIVSVAHGYEIYLVSSNDNDVVIVELGVDPLLSCDWAPSLEFENRSVGDFANLGFGEVSLLVVAVGGIPSGRTLLGSLVGSEGQKAGGVTVNNVEYGKSDDVSEGIVVSTNLPKFKLLDSFPNPFNPSTTMAFWLKERSSVDLAIYDLSGKVINTVFSNESFNSGRHEYKWNGQDNRGRRVSSGTYFYKLGVGDDAVTKSMTLLK